MKTRSAFFHKKPIRDHLPPECIWPLYGVRGYRTCGRSFVRQQYGARAKDGNVVFPQFVAVTSLYTIVAKDTSFVIYGMAVNTSRTAEQIVTTRWRRWWFISYSPTLIWKKPSFSARACVRLYHIRIKYIKRAYVPAGPRADNHITLIRRGTESKFLANLWRQVES